MTLPRQNSRLIDDDGRPTREFYDWMRRLETVAEPDPPLTIADISDIALNSVVDGQPLVWDNTVGRLLNRPTVTFTPTTTPSTPVAGMVYYDQGTNKLRCYNGTSWNDLF
jgi:hypothetical protein